MTTVSVSVLDESDPAQLFHHYLGQYDRQPVHLELDAETGKFRADWNGEIGNGIPASVYHGRTLRWGLPLVPTVAAANRLVTDLIPLAQAVLDGYTVEWDGRNHVGYPSTDAAASAIEAIGEQCAGFGEPDSDVVQEYDAADWFCEGLGDIAITLDTTDAEITSFARQAERDATTLGPAYYILTGAEEYLATRRDETARRHTPIHRHGVTMPAWLED